MKGMEMDLKEELFWDLAEAAVSELEIDLGEIETISIGLEGKMDGLMGGGKDLDTLRRSIEEEIRTIRKNP